MKPERLPTLRALVPLLEKLGSSGVDLELFVLKCHLIVEREMYGLLAARLEVDEKQLPSLQFFPLAKLALGGLAYRSTLRHVQALNDLRNEYSHELDDNTLRKRMAGLAAKTGTFWPQNDKLGQPTQWLALCESSVRVAAFACILEVWQHAAEVLLAKHLYPSEAAEAEARQDLDRTTGILAAAKRQQQSYTQLYQAIKLA